MPLGLKIRFVALRLFDVLERGLCMVQGETKHPRTPGFSKADVSNKTFSHSHRFVPFFYSTLGVLRGRVSTCDLRRKDCAKFGESLAAIWSLVDPISSELTDIKRRELRRRCFGADFFRSLRIFAV